MINNRFYREDKEAELLCDMSPEMQATVIQNSLLWNEVEFMLYIPQSKTKFNRRDLNAKFDDFMLKPDQRGKSSENYQNDFNTTNKI